MSVSAFSVNFTVKCGRVGQDPEIKYTPQGKAVAKFSLATTETYGKDQKKTDWHNIEAWGWNAEYANELIRKGDEVVVIGSVVYESWDGKDGNKVYRTKIVANFLRATVTRNSNQQQEQAPPQYQQQNTRRPANNNRQQQQYPERW